MPKNRLLERAKKWTPDPNDPYGNDKKTLIEYLIRENASASNPIPIGALRTAAAFSKTFSNEFIQVNLIGPLRRDRNLFIGTSSKGVFLVTSAADVDTTLSFYTSRIRAELRHARNLRTLAKRLNLHRRGTSGAAPKERAVIFMDESGNANVSDLKPAVFVVAAVVIESRQAVVGLEQRFRNALATIKRGPDDELRTKSLSPHKHAQVLRDLSLIDYQWAAACFHKSKLTSPGFAAPKVFYRYAFQFLTGELLTLASQADLVLDEHSNARFQDELAEYLRKQNAGLPINHLGKITFGSSGRQRLIQLADLVAGAVRRDVEGEHGPLREIDHQMLTLQHWPPR